MEKIEVYHAGTDRIESPDCLRGRRNLDFGRGFYITDVYDQAYNLALSRSRDRKMPVLFPPRRGRLWRNYDYVEGGVADDRVIDTVNMYIQGFISQERALQNLRYLKPNNQICILNQDMLESHLKFTDCQIISSDGLL